MPYEPDDKRPRKSKITTAGTLLGRDRAGNEMRASRVRIGGKVVNDPPPKPKRPKARPPSIESNAGARSADVATSTNSRAEKVDMSTGPSTRGGKRRVKTEGMSPGPSTRGGKRRAKPEDTATVFDRGGKRRVKRKPRTKAKSSTWRRLLGMR